MTLGVLDNWIFMSLFATGAWALSCVIDVCFVSNGVYRKASDGPAIAGLFCIVPMVVSSSTLDWTNVNWTVVCVGMLSGIVFLLHIYFYFKALFSLNDAVNAEIFNTLCVLFVPVLAFVLLGERLAWPNYMAIALAVLGIFVLVRLSVIQAVVRRRLLPDHLGYRGFPDDGDASMGTAVHKLCHRGLAVLVVGVRHGHFCLRHTERQSSTHRKHVPAIWCTFRRCPIARARGRAGFSAGNGRGAFGFSCGPHRMLAADFRNGV